MNYDPSEKEIKLVRESLTAFNNVYAGEDGHAALNIVEYDKDGNVIAGILGGTYWGWMYVDILWVHEAHRKKGLGSKLLLAAEAEASRRGCPRPLKRGRRTSRSAPPCRTTCRIARHEASLPLGRTDRACSPRRQARRA